MMKSLCVFCGSSPGRNPGYFAAARDLGRLLAAQQVDVVYGGGRVGLMGAVADGALEAGGRVVGVIPHGLWAREVGHTGLSELHVVNTMHERKAKMAELSDGFVALPGGIGTLEEFFEVWTWGQLGIHAKPFGILNIGGFFDPLVTFLDHLVREQFVRETYRALVVVESSADALLDRLRAFQAPTVEKWLDMERT